MELKVGLDQQGQSLCWGPVAVGAAWGSTMNKALPSGGRLPSKEELAGQTALQVPQATHPPVAVQVRNVCVFVHKCVYMYMFVGVCAYMHEYMICIQLTLGQHKLGH